MLPIITGSNRQRAVKVDLPKIRRIVQVALPLVPMGFNLYFEAAVVG
jgi:hypothetical protein